MTAAYAGGVVDETIELFGTYGPRGAGDFRAVWPALEIVREGAPRRVRRSGGQSGA